MSLEGKFVFLHPDQRHLAANIRGWEVIIAESFNGSLEDWKVRKPWDESQNTPSDNFIAGFKAGYLAASGESNHVA